MLFDDLIEGVVPIKIFYLSGLCIAVVEGIELYSFRVGTDELLHDLDRFLCTSLSSESVQESMSMLPL